MTFALPLALISLVLVPLLVGAYLLQLRRARRRTVRFSNVALLRTVVPKHSAWRRHVPPVLLFGAVAVLGVAGARPQATVTIPVGRTTIILALDVSRSMCATDVEPNRLAVAQDAASRFVKSQPKGVRIGIVAFSGSAQLIVPPTTDDDQLLKAIAGLTTARGTAIGSAMLTSIDALAEINPDITPVGPVGAAAPAGRSGSDAPPAAAVPSPANGEFVGDIVVLLTDGANTRGVQPLDAAPEAVARGVRVYTIGFGTMNPAGLSCSRAQLGAEGFGGDGGGFGGGGPGGGGGGPGGGGPPRSFLVIDEDTLQSVAAETGGEYYRAENADQLVEVFETLPRAVKPQTDEREVTAAFTAAGALLLLGALGASIRFAPRLS